MSAKPHVLVAGAGLGRLAAANALLHARLWTALAAIAIFLAAPLSPRPVQAADGATTERLELIYSADDKLCGTVVDVFNRLHAKYPKANYLSELRGELYRDTGLSRPRRLSPSDPALDEFPDHTPGWFFRADVAGDGRQRVVYVRDWERGSHGDYTTEIWVFRPGKGYREKEGLYTFSKKMVTDINPIVIDLHVKFLAQPVRWPFHYPSVKVPKERFEFSAVPQPSEDARKFVGMPRFGGPLPQEAFSFGGQIYFAAGAPLTAFGLIYRVTKDMTAQAACLVVRDLEKLKASEFWK